MLSRRETIKLIPTVEPEHLTGGVVYHDGQFDDARLAVNLAQTAYDLGAAVVNYCRCVDIVKKGDIVAGVVARDQESGEEFTIRARSVINATGVFVDDLRRLDDRASRRLVAVSQGIHIVLPKSFLPGTTAIMIPKTADGRVLFAVPWHDKVVVGTTDTPLPGHSLEPRALDEERDFVMSHACRYLAKGPTDSDVLSIFAGQRPLVDTGNAANTAALSRDHTILVSPSGLITITGRQVDHLPQDGRGRHRPGRDDRGRRGHPEPHRGHARPRVDPGEDPREEPPALRVGRGQDRRAHQGDTNGLSQKKLHPALPYQQGEVVWQVRHEMARCVEDVLARRTRALILNARASIEAAPARRAPRRGRARPRRCLAGPPGGRLHGPCPRLRLHRPGEPLPPGARRP
jgi:glycerol-3-phosphate dehydrogenase